MTYNRRCKSVVDLFLFWQLYRETGKTTFESPNVPKKFEYSIEKTVQSGSSKSSKDSKLTSGAFDLKNTVGVGHSYDRVQIVPFQNTDLNMQLFNSETPKSEISESNISEQIKVRDQAIGDNNQILVNDEWERIEKYTSDLLATNNPSDSIKDDEF